MGCKRSRGVDKVRSIYMSDCIVLCYCRGEVHARLPHAFKFAFLVYVVTGEYRNERIAEEKAFVETLTAFYLSLDCWYQVWNQKNSTGVYELDIFSSISIFSMPGNML